MKTARSLRNTAHNPKTTDEQKRELLELSLIAAHSALYAVHRDYAERTTGRVLPEQKDTRSALGDLMRHDRSPTGERIRSALAHSRQELADLTQVRNDAFYLDANRTRALDALDSLVERGIAAAEEALQIYPHVRATAYSRERQRLHDRRG